MSDAHDLHRFTHDGHVVHIELNRPARLNAFTVGAITALKSRIDAIAADPAIRVVTMRGAGKAFSTGVDLKEFPKDGMGPDRIDAWEGMLRTIETMDKLVVCLIHGYAVGGGLQLALACDIRVCATGAKVGLPANKEGIIPGLATYRLARYVGLGRAKQLIYLGNLIDAARAEQIGLVDHLVDEDGRLDAFNELVKTYDQAFSNGARCAKPLLAECLHSDFESFFELYKLQQNKAVESPDFIEAQAAYRDGREATWDGTRETN
jgi:enoyl-CoA hydratase/carnithine racemase